MDLIVIIVIISFIVKKIKNSSDMGLSNSQRADKRQHYGQRMKDTRYQNFSRTTYDSSGARSSVNNQNDHWKSLARENIEKAKNRAKKTLEELKWELEFGEDSEDEIMKPSKNRQMRLERMAMQRQQTDEKEQIFASRQESKNSSILERAKANTEENKADITLDTLEAEHQHSERVSPAEHYHPEDILSENLLGSIEDLMVKGYDGNLCFERDFVGEALDMISQFSVPSEVPDFSGNQEDVA